MSDKKKEVTFLQIEHNEFDELIVDENENNNLDNLNELPDSEENDVENNDKKSDKKMFTPEATMERLEKMPNRIREIYRNADITTCFDVFLYTLKKRCEGNFTNVYEEMWTNNTQKLCVRFKNNYLSNSNEKEDIPNEFIEYMTNTSVVEILQTFNDISQINGHNAKLELEILENTDGSTDKIINQARQYFYACKDLYHNFVDLYQYCTGTWNPYKKRNSQKNNSHSEFKQYKNNYESQNKVSTNPKRNNNNNTFRDDRPNYSNGSFQRSKNGASSNRQLQNNHLEQEKNHQETSDNHMKHQSQYGRGRTKYGPNKMSNPVNQDSFNSKNNNFRNKDNFNDRNNFRNQDNFNDRNNNFRNQDNFDGRNNNFKNLSKTNTNRDRGSFKFKTNNSMPGENSNGGFRNRHK